MLLGCLVVFYVSVEPFNPLRGRRRGDVRARRATDMLATDGAGRRAPPAARRGSVAAAVARCRSTHAARSRRRREHDDRCRPRRRPSRSSATRRRTRWRSTCPTGSRRRSRTCVNGSVDGCSVYDSGSVDERRQLLEQLRHVRRLAGRLGGGRRRPGRRARGGRGVGRVRHGGRDGTVYRVRYRRPPTRLWMAQRAVGHRRDARRRVPRSGCWRSACMRPIDVEGAGVPALPERGDDARIAHLNDLLAQVADVRTATEVGADRRAPTSGATTRRSPPTSATAGTASTSTSPAPTSSTPRSPRSSSSSPPDRRNSVRSGSGPDGPGRWLGGPSDRARVSRRGWRCRPGASHTSISSPSNRKAAFWTRTLASLRGSPCGSWPSLGAICSNGIGSAPESQITRPESADGVLERVDAPAGLDLAAATVGGDRSMDRYAHRAGGDHRRQLRHLVVAERDVHQHRLLRRVGQRIVDDVVDVAGPLGAVPHHLDHRQQQRRGRASLG